MAVDTNGQRHPGIMAIARWFEGQHLPKHLQGVSALIENTAENLLWMIGTDSPELTEGLRKLLEAKDCFVRAAITHHQNTINEVTNVYDTKEN